MLTRVIRGVGEMLTPSRKFPSPIMVALLPRLTMEFKFIKRSPVPGRYVCCRSVDKIHISSKQICQSY